MAIERKTAAGQLMDDYWKNAWQESKDREMKANALAHKRLSEIKSLKVELNSMKAERDRWHKEAVNLRRKLVAIEDAARDLMDDEDSEDYLKDSNGAYKSENGFDQRDHYREM
jgi:hypothetical protein